MATETSSSTATSKSSILPKIHLLCMLSEASDAFDRAVKKYYPTLRDVADIEVHNLRLSEVPDKVKFDAIVSPANSYARLDGAFDDAIARAFGTDYDWITHKAQKAVYERWRGYVPPGTCTVISMMEDAGNAAAKEGDWEVVEENKDQQAGQEHKWGCKYLLLCPTMRTPANVRWDKEVIYECVWTLLCSIDAHNRALSNAPSATELPINSILMTPLATGVGLVSNDKWAAQCVLAIKHYVQAVQNPDLWSNLQWGDIAKVSAELRSTLDL